MSESKDLKIRFHLDCDILLGTITHCTEQVTNVQKTLQLTTSGAFERTWMFHYHCKSKHYENGITTLFLPNLPCKLDGSSSFSLYLIFDSICFALSAKTTLRTVFVTHFHSAFLKAMSSTCYPPQYINLNLSLNISSFSVFVTSSSNILTQAANTPLLKLLAVLAEWFCTSFIEIWNTRAFILSDW